MTNTTVAISDPAPKDMHIGAINPYALLEAIVGKKFDRNSADSARVISDKHIGAINLYALLEAIMGKKFDRNLADCTWAISDIL
jgi:hypothetical protein